MSDYYTSSDENAEELPVEYDLELNKKLAQAVKGEDLNNDDNDEENDEPRRTKEFTKEEEMKLLKENENILKQIADADPKDEADSFLKDFFGKRKWEEKTMKNPTQEDIAQDDDLEEIDQGIEFEKKYNFRHEEEGFDIIPTNPRFVEGEDRVKETNRHKKRREAAEQSKIDDVEVQRRLDEIDEKYKKIADANNGKLTNEQLHEYTEECADVYIEQQDGAFQYIEVNNNGGIEKSIKILNDPDFHEEEEEFDDESDDEKKKKDRKQGINNTFRRNDNHRGGPRGGFRGGRGGKFSGNRGGGRGRSGDINGGRANTYNLHRH